jgi:hypothetical protein
MKTVLAVFFLILAASPACAGFVTGDELRAKMRTCDNLPEQFKPSQENANAFQECGFVMGYLAGASDAYVDTSFASKCMAKEIILSQLKVVVRDWLDQHPDRLHEPAVWLVRDAISEYGPCPGD